MKKKRKKIEWFDKKNFIVNIDVFDTQVGVYVNYTYGEMVKHIKKIAKKDYYDKFIETYGEKCEIEEQVNGQMYKMGGGFILILRSGDRGFRYFINTVVHEVTHITHYLCRNRRISLTEDSEEIYCYLVGFLTEQILRKLYK